MRQVKIHSLWLSLCLSIIYLSSVFLSTSVHRQTSEAINIENISISDASAKIHLEDIISEGLFTVPSPYIEISNNQLPSFTRIKTDDFCTDKTPIQISSQGGTIESRSQNISRQFEYSSHYYIFALHHIII